ncbi:uncharacterized protein LOC100890286 isoform X2 [Strongylocentrotus purpuratus]|uniref:Uncharacterized protein n=1 Tax=Strongylocentrotus purpuratus TaxID=7668 RepID=A0A7M7P7U3_STRPU|nr:uncharacterized protein LOC100890286 isoform X2 [Strongylocentrotus purpuratus]
MPLVGKHVYQCFKSCSFVPYFDPDPLEQLSDHCICEPHHLPTHQQPTSTTSKRPPTSSSSTKRPPRGRSGGGKLKGSSLFDEGFNEWSPQDDHGASKKQNGRTAIRGTTTRRKSDRNAPNLQGEYTSESNRQTQKDYQTFRFYDDTSRYMAEYRARHTQRLVGFDGSSDLEDLTFGENLPDPYIFKTAPFKRAFEVMQSAMLAERKQVSNGQKGQVCPNLSPTNNERHQWRPSDVKHLPGLTTQPIFATNVDAVCAGMRHVGQDVFKPIPLPQKRRPDNSTSNSIRSLASRQNKAEEKAAAGDKLEMALAQSRLAMRDRLDFNEEQSILSRKSSSSSMRSPDNLSIKTTTLSTITSSTAKSKADWMALPVDQGEATRTMLLFLQKARGDVDRSRENRTRRTLPNGKSIADETSTTEKQRFTAMLCRESEKRRLKSTETVSEPSPPVAGQLKSGRLKMKVFRASGTGDIKLGEALKAGRLHVTVGLGT